MLPICRPSNKGLVQEGGSHCVELRSRRYPYLRTKIRCSDLSQMLFLLFSLLLCLFWLDRYSLRGAQAQLDSKRYPLRMRCESGEDDKEEA